ncbi:MAG: hypothetical protein GY913_02745 [Proteobacteria bacterium]|nr:hypothetical protein [Pseudomonadota bacterium]MCP4915816.1 hypothetical protein [Pseudomonadota bacterium]
MIEQRLVHRLLFVFAALILAAAVILAIRSEPAEALPFYAQRSGRTCANCHVSPTLEDEEGWENPELAERKCTMSCTSCHVDPTGGGQRNASGRYYGQSTLGMLHTQDRSYSDHGREILGNDMLWKAQNFLGEPADVAEGERLVPSTEEDWESGMGAGQTGNYAALGTPLGEEPSMAFWDGRYDDLAADPMFQFGGDVRGAWWSATRTAFPMQVDLHAAFHPVHHLMFVTTIAARGRTTGGLYTPPVFLRRAFVMVNELPYFAYAKAGIFMPDYGVFIEDHTRFTREMFEMDLSTSQDTVLGVQVGATPNYPTLSASLFANDTSWLDGGEKDEGWGATVNGGWRDLGWTVTGHAMHKQRRGQGRGGPVSGRRRLGPEPGVPVGAHPGDADRRDEPGPSQLGHGQVGDLRRQNGPARLDRPQWHQPAAHRGSRGAGPVLAAPAPAVRCDASGHADAGAHLQRDRPADARGERRCGP